MILVMLMIVTVCVVGVAIKLVADEMDKVDETDMDMQDYE